MAETAQENIVSLEDYEHRRAVGKGASAQAMREAYRIATESLQGHISIMMGKVDDTLFDRAEKSECDAVQTHYFDAMRELRVARKNIEEDFITLLNANFINGVPRESSMIGNISLNWENDIDKLDSADKSDLEENIAIANLVHKIRNSCSAQLVPLDTRIGFLMSDPDLERWINPLGPELICEAFKAAVRHIESGLDIRIISYKLFDQYVAAHLEDIYTQINERLVDLGVLPQIKVPVAESNDETLETPAAGNSATEPKSKFPHSEYSRHDLSSLPTAPGILPGYYDFRHANPAINILTLMQHGSHRADNASFSSQGQITPGCGNILHDMRTSSLARNLGENGATTIGVVAMIFDYILNDRNIPEPMRTLIGNLQIPVLKVALLDADFLSRKSHPARRLLNRLAVTALGWDEQQGKQDPLYQKIESTVKSILEQFGDNVDLFGTLLSEFDAFLQQEEAQAQARAARTAKIMEGQERLEIAKDITLDEIKPRINDDGNIDFVREFVITHWKNLLFICCARNGKDSEAWKQAVTTMDELIWSIKPKQTSQDRKRLAAIQPALVRNLRSGMERLAIPVTERDNFIARLMQAHARTALSETEKTVAVAPAKPADSTRTPASKPINPAPRKAPNARTLMEPGEAYYLQQVKAMKPGIWLEFIGSHGQTSRVKLSWISPITGTFLFTDRQGLKAGNYTTDELVTMLNARLARIIDTAPLMDRAVSTALQTES
ncbi:MAG: DUF1631 domain-containing protein [Thiogranum sp.]|nr:DUF1631 domain-containing protein [Thiogranum sp.]